MFTLNPRGVGILAQRASLGCGLDSGHFFLGPYGTGRWSRKLVSEKDNPVRKGHAFGGGLMLVYPVVLFDAIGVVLMGAVVVSQKMRKSALWSLSRCVKKPKYHAQKSGVDKGHGGLKADQRRPLADQRRPLADSLQAKWLFIEEPPCESTEFLTALPATSLGLS